MVTYSTSAHHQERLYGASCLWHDGTPYVFGGGSIGQMHTCIRYDRQSRQWLDIAPLPVAASRLHAIAVKDGFKLIGGPAPREKQHRHFGYNPITDEWHPCGNDDKWQWPVRFGNYKLAFMIMIPENNGTLLVHGRRRGNEVDAYALYALPFAKERLIDSVVGMTEWIRLPDVPHQTKIHSHKISIRCITPLTV
jgi:hypothetical protein